jgi:hypothetical protein
VVVVVLVVVVVVVVVVFVAAAAAASLVCVCVCVRVRTCGHYSRTLYVSGAGASSRCGIDIEQRLVRLIASMSHGSHHSAIWGASLH